MELARPLGPRNEFDQEQLFKNAGEAWTSLTSHQQDQVREALDRSGSKPGGDKFPTVGALDPHLITTSMEAALQRYQEQSNRLARKKQEIEGQLGSFIEHYQQDLSNGPISPSLLRYGAGGGNVDPGGSNQALGPISPTSLRPLPYSPVKPFRYAPAALQSTGDARPALAAASSPQGLLQTAPSARPFIPCDPQTPGQSSTQGNASQQPTRTMVVSADRPSDQGAERHKRKVRDLPCPKMDHGHSRSGADKHSVVARHLQAQET